MTKQKALLLTSKQGAFAVHDLDVPEPNPGELLVEVHSTGLNPLDWKIAVLGWLITDYPAVLGGDAAGVVKAVGEGVTSFKVGDKVIYESDFTNRGGTFQQYSIIGADFAAKLPSNLSFDEGATIPAALVTAAYGLYSKFVHLPERGGAGLTPWWEEGGRGKYAGQPIVVMGGSSAVGQQVIQIARLSGFSPIIVTASTHNTFFLQSLGATHVLDRSVPLGPAIQSITSAPINTIYDAIAVPETQGPAWDILAPGGILILALPPTIDDAKINEGRKEGKELVFVFGSVHDPTQKDLGVKLNEHLSEAFESGELKPNRVEVLSGGLAAIPEGLERLRLNQVSGTKLIARPQESL